MEKNIEDKVLNKKEYIKPMVTKVKLAPSEIVLGCVRTSLEACAPASSI